MKVLVLSKEEYEFVKMLMRKEDKEIGKIVDEIKRQNGQNAVRNFYKHDNEYRIFKKLAKKTRK